jgi:putative lipoic acid-binding regulatory protein
MYKERLKDISEKMKSDKDYAEKLFTDYDFAQKEFMSANITIDSNSFQQLSNAYKALESAATNTLGKNSGMEMAVRGEIV